jgi:hypothetical protein
VNAIVNAANHRAAGPALLEECRQLAGCKDVHKLILFTLRENGKKMNRIPPCLSAPIYG